MQRNANKKGKRKPISKEDLKALVQSALIKGPEGAPARRRCFELLGLLPERPEQETNSAYRLAQSKLREAIDEALDGEVDVYEIELDRLNRLRVEIIEDLNQGR